MRKTKENFGRYSTVNLSPDIQIDTFRIHVRHITARANFLCIFWKVTNIPAY